MVLHGQSAGGASVDYYAYAWTDDPIVSGFIPQSGSASMRSSGPGDPATAAANQWSALSDKLGCGTVTVQDVEKTLSCMKSKSLAAVMDATAPAKGGGKSLGSFGPKPDGKTVFADVTERGNAGKFIKAVS